MAVTLFSCGQPDIEKINDFGTINADAHYNSKKYNCNPGDCDRRKRTYRPRNSQELAFGTMIVVNHSVHGEKASGQQGAIDAKTIEIIVIMQL